MDRWTDADDDINARRRAPPQGRVAAAGLAAFIKSSGTGTEGAQSFGKIEVVASKRARSAPDTQDINSSRRPLLCASTSGPRWSRSTHPFPDTAPPTLNPPPLHQDQRKAEATAEANRLMPPPKLPNFAAPAAATEPTLLQSVPAATGPPKCPVPSWAGQPPAGSRLLVIKDGSIIQDVGLAKVVTVFGRVDALADVVLDHPSISRQHATAAWHPGRGAWLVTDLGSTHGTFVGERQLAKNEPTELLPGVELRFAASTRRYRLPVGAPKAAAAAAAAGTQGVEAGRLHGVLEAAGSARPAAPAAGGGGGNGATAGGGKTATPSELMPPPPPKRPRVCFADDALAGGAAAPSGVPRGPLETVIGFSDGRDFAARVGPKAAASEEGRFASAVASTTIRVVSPRSGSACASAWAGAAGDEGDAGALGRTRNGGVGGGAAAGSRKAPGSPRPGYGRGESLKRDSEGGSKGGGGGEEAAVGIGASGSGAAAGPAPVTGMARTGSGSGSGTLGEEVRPQLQDFVDRIRREPQRIGGGGSLYEMLPPPAR